MIVINIIIFEGVSILFGKIRGLKFILGKTVIGEKQSGRVFPV